MPSNEHYTDRCQYCGRTFEGEKHQVEALLEYHEKTCYVQDYVEPIYGNTDTDNEEEDTNE